MARLRFEAFELDPDNAELRRNGVTARIQPQPLKVLALLAARAGQVVSRDDLRQQVWPNDTFVDFDHGLNYCIRQIRVVLADDPAAPRFIETVPRRGYRFVARVSVDAGEPAQRIMLAVLPFENLSGDSEQEFFSDGLTEEMIAQLGRLNPQRLGVIARTSAMRYKHTDHSVGAIGRELGVSHLLEGSVRRAGDRARITARLVRIAEQTQVWAHSFDRSVGDILAVQRDIARQIATEIGVQLTPEARLRLDSPRSVDFAAYEAYLKGRYFWGKRTPDSLRRSVASFEQAVALDPGYAAAYAGLADAYLTQFDSNLLPSREAFALADRAISDSLRLEDALAEPHASLGHLRFHEFEWAVAEREFIRAIDLNPGYASARYYYANLLAALGRFDQALAEADVAHALDPLSMNARQNRAVILYFARRYDQALQALLEAIDIDPAHVGLYYDLGRVYAARGRYDGAAAALSKADGARGSSASAMLAYTHALAGRPDLASAILKQLDHLSDREYVSSYDLAIVNVALGDVERALALFSRAFEEYSSNVPFLKVDARLDPLRSDTRYDVLVRRLRMPAVG